MQFLENMAAGRVRCVFAADPRATIKDLLAWGSTLRDGDRIAVCRIDPAKSVLDFPATLVSSLANAALAVWPDWYGRPDLFSGCDESSWQPTFDAFAAGTASSDKRDVLLPWLQQAVPMCRAGRPPILDGFSPGLQLEQLAAAIAAKELLLAAYVEPGDVPESAPLLGLARNLEKVARQTPARVVAVLPISLRGRVELDSISWDCRVINDVPPERPDATSDDEPLRVVCPIRGRPHPNSPGEQLLALHLGRDPQLGPLFEYNMPVTTARSSRHQIDLVWFAGKIAVEVDGYGWHSSRSEFESDRNRDYELQLSGYMVLRLPHESVIRDVELAVDKIRDFVKLRLSSMALQERTA